MRPERAPLQAYRREVHAAQDCARRRPEGAEGRCRPADQRGAAQTSGCLAEYATMAAIRHRWYVLETKSVNADTIFLPKTVETDKRTYTCVLTCLWPGELIISSRVARIY